jgi:hypothetical protein
VLYASWNTALSPETATDFSGPKDGNLSTESQHPRHQSVDKKQ